MVLRWPRGFGSPVLPGVVLLALGVSGCGSTSTNDDYDAVRELARARAHLDLPARQARTRLVMHGERAGEAADAEHEPDVRALLREPLTEAAALRIALLNNRELRAELHALGIARGQLVQANVLPNPVFDVALRVPQASGASLQWDVEVGIDLTALILQGDAAVASAQLQASRYAVASAVLALGLHVRKEFYALLASQQKLELMQTALAAFAAGYETARALHAAGNLRDLDLVTEQAAYESSRILVAQVEAELLDDREQLNVLLGLHAGQTTWQVVGNLPELPAEAVERAQLEQAESRAIAANLELAEARAQLTAVSRQVALTKNSVWLAGLTVGASAEYDDDHWSIGPMLSGTLPLFDRQQGALMVSQARFEQLRERYVALSVEIRAAARALRNRTLSAHERARHYRDVLLPLRQRVVEHSVRQYNAMQIGVFQLLQARREQLDTARDYIETLREYWTTRADFDQLLAGRRPAAIGPQRPGAAVDATPASQ